MKVIEMIRSAKRNFFKKNMEEFTRSNDYVYLHELLYCPRKIELQKEYDNEAISEVTEVIDGFLTEEFLTKFSDEKVKNNELFISERKVEGKKVATHVDLLGRTFACEVKTTTYVYAKQTPLEKEIYFGKEAENFRIPENYLKQAKLQAFLLSEKMNVEYYLILKSMTTVFSPKLGKTRMKKIWIVLPVEPATEEEWQKAIEEYEEKKKMMEPFYDWECKYCSFFKVLCEGKKEEEEKELPKEEILKLYEEYLKKREELKSLEMELRKLLSGKSLEVAGKTIGYCERESEVWNLEKLVEVLEKEELTEVLTVNWRKKEKLRELIKRKNLDEREIVEVVKRREFRL